MLDYQLLKWVVVLVVGWWWWWWWLCGDGMEEVDVGSSFLFLLHDEVGAFLLLLVHGEESMGRESLTRERDEKKK